MYIKPTSADPEETRDSPELAAPPTPRWVKAFGIAFLLVIVLVIVMLAHGLITGQGPFEHGMH
jgi:hypothetical protein